MTISQMRDNDRPSGRNDQPRQRLMTQHFTIYFLSQRSPVSGTKPDYFFLSLSALGREYQI